MIEYFYLAKIKREPDQTTWNPKFIGLKWSLYWRAYFVGSKFYNLFLSVLSLSHNATGGSINAVY
jgi:hypothetical protein